MTQEYTQFLLKIGDFALENKQPRLKDSVRDLLLLVPSGEGRGGEEREWQRGSVCVGVGVCVLGWECVCWGRSVCAGVGVCALG